VVTLDEAKRAYEEHLRDLKQICTDRLQGPKIEVSLSQVKLDVITSDQETSPVSRQTVRE
jgi:hypothetical protein